MKININININKKKLKSSIIIFILLSIICIIGFKFGQKSIGNIIGFGVTIIGSFIISFLNMLNINYDEKRAKWINKLVSFGTIFTTFIMAELLNSINMLNIDIKLIFLNLVLITMIYFIVSIFTTKGKLVIIISNSLIFLLAFTNLLVTKFRGTPFVPWDILSIGTAATVAGNYSFAITPRVVLSILILFANIIISLKLKNNKITIKRKMIISLCSLIIVFCFFFNFITSDVIINYFNVKTDVWQPIKEYKQNGIVLSFFKQSRNLFMKEPDGYSQEKVTSILENIDAVEVSSNIETTEEQIKPNIIVIMNESLADLRIIEDFETSEEVFSFIYSLKENTIKGNLHVSVFGGSTPNTEWEFLTGNTMAFVPWYSVPYQQYLFRESSSLARTLKAQGYTTHAFHCYNAARI